MIQRTISNYQAPVCKAIRVRTARPLADSLTDPNSLNFGYEDAAGGRIDNNDIINVTL